MRASLLEHRTSTIGTFAECSTAAVVFALVINTLPMERCISCIRQALWSWRLIFAPNQKNTRTRGEINKRSPALRPSPSSARALVERVANYKSILLRSLVDLVDELVEHLQTTSERRLSDVRNKDPGSGAWTSPATARTDSAKTRRERKETTKEVSHAYSRERYNSCSNGSCTEKWRVRRATPRNKTRPGHNTCTKTKTQASLGAPRSQTQTSCAAVRDNRAGTCLLSLHTGRRGPERYREQALSRPHLVGDVLDLRDELLDLLVSLLLVLGVHRL